MGRMRDLRQSLGMSQANVAAAAGLSRQLVGAVESGRHAPSVHAALALAAVLGTTVEDLFRPPASERALVPVGDRPTEEGAPVVATTVGDRLCYETLPHRGATGAAWLAADGTYDGGVIRLFPGAHATGAVVAGCDPALGLAAGMPPPPGPPRVLGPPAPSPPAAGGLA